MEIFERVNLLLKEKKLSKKDFAIKLRNLEPKLNNTLEIPSEKSIYAYLTGRVSIRVELIPYIAEVLEIPEQLLFDDSQRARKIFLKHILKDISNEEKELLKDKICPEKSQKIVIAQDRFHQINDLLVYAPEIFLQNLENTLKNYKDLTLKFTK